MLVEKSWVTSKMRSNSLRTATNDASKGGSRDGESPQQPTKPRRSLEMTQARWRTERTLDIVSHKPEQGDAS